MTPAIGVMFRREQHPATLIDYARRVEAMGFDQLWVVEDCFYLGGIAQAAVALAATSHITVGVGINPAVARNPAFLAMEYATLASAFPGRFVGGIGHGFGGWMEQVGAKPASWLRSIEEITTSVRRILRGEEVTVHGAYVNLDAVRLNAALDVVPAVLLGVMAEKSVRLAGACADGLVLAEGSSPDYVRWARAQMMTARVEAGRGDGGSVVVFADCRVDETNPEGVRARIRDQVAESNASGPRPQFAKADFGPEMAAIAARGGADGLRAEMPEAWIDAVAISGTEAQGLAAIDRLGDAGADAVVLVPPDDADWNAWLGDPFMRRVTGNRDASPAGFSEDPT